MLMTAVPPVQHSYLCINNSFACKLCSWDQVEALCLSQMQWEAWWDAPGSTVGVCCPSRLLPFASAATSSLHASGLTAIVSAPCNQEPNFESVQLQYNFIKGSVWKAWHITLVHAMRYYPYPPEQVNPSARYNVQPLWQSDGVAFPSAHDAAIDDRARRTCSLCVHATYNCHISGSCTCVCSQLNTWVSLKHSMALHIRPIEGMQPKCCNLCLWMQRWYN